MRSFFLGLFLLVGFFVFSDGVDAADWCVDRAFKCCNAVGACINEPTICASDDDSKQAEKKCLEALVAVMEAAKTLQCLPASYEPPITGITCVEKTVPGSKCKALPEGECISSTQTCATGKKEIVSDCPDAGACCVSLTDPCSGGSCMTQAKCDEAKGTVVSTCPGASACEATEVFCVVKSGPGPGPGPGPGTYPGAVIEFENPLKYDTVQEVVGALLAALQGIIVLLSIVFIVIGAVMYVTSAGNEGMVKLAKGAILASMIGLAIGIAAPTFLKEIYDILDATPEVTIPEEVESATPLRDILTNTLNFLLAIIGVLSMIMLVVGGIMYLLSGGDEKRIDTGKKIVVFSLIGLTVALASLILVRQIANFFG
ncbi:MAG: hypothetical protein EOM19_05175 [Candidatus Moranbacteria bacterium]|nr:hypothetical protein [Candidatus Moranbacteria bacterium]